MENFKKVTLIFVTYFSKKKLLEFLKNTPKDINIIVIDNSKDKSLEALKKKFKKLEIIFGNNQGYGASINYASKKVKTKYFFAVQVDVEGINKHSLNKFIYYAEKLNDKFSFLGPRFIDAPKKGHIQSDNTKELQKIFCVHGSAMFFNKKNFDKISGFDEKFFLYWEERDLAKKFEKINLYCYQINCINVKHFKGSSVILHNDSDNLINLYNWHFIWSKFYFFKKHYGLLISLLSFIPVIIRIHYRIILYTIINNKKKQKKYFIRWDGLKKSILNKNSSMRIELVEKIK